MGRHYVCSRHFPPNAWTAKGNFKKSFTPLRVAEVEINVVDESHTVPLSDTGLPYEDHVRFKVKIII